MKILLTVITTIILIFISVFAIKQYRAPALSNQPVVTINEMPSFTPGHADSSLINDHSVNLAHKSAKHIDSKNHKEKNHKEKKHVSGLEVNKLISAASSQGLKPKALKSALNAYSWARNHNKLGNNKDIITVVDFDLPSFQKRMWVLSLRQNRVLMKLYTTQGAGSGLVYASRFSNTSMTQASSLGLYVTSDEYYGKHGKSMRLNGLQKGINNNARSRSIVIHEAGYASPAYVRANHRAGRSWGCFAVAPESKNALLHYVRGGSAFFAYARQITGSSIVSNGPLSV